MRSSLVSVVVLTVALGLPLTAAAQPDEQATTATTPRPAKAGGDSPDQAATTARPTPPLFKSLSNVQIELTISDQVGSGPVQKKTVSMIAASGTWGKIRAAGVARPNDRSAVVPVGLNVDARPFVQPEGIVQVELTIGYNPFDPLAAERSEPSGQARPTELNQSLTVVLQSGKPLVVSQAADPVSDRKIIVEVKATIMK
jgi:hypothetical protein